MNNNDKQLPDLTKHCDALMTAADKLKEHYTELEMLLEKIKDLNDPDRVTLMADYYGVSEQEYRVYEMLKARSKAHRQPVIDIAPDAKPEGNTPPLNSLADFPRQSQNKRG